jgi:hypothetical protein
MSDEKRLSVLLQRAEWGKRHCQGQTGSACAVHRTWPSWAGCAHPAARSQFAVRVRELNGEPKHLTRFVGWGLSSSSPSTYSAVSCRSPTIGFSCSFMLRCVRPAKQLQGMPTAEWSPWNRCGACRPRLDRQARWRGSRYTCRVSHRRITVAKDLFALETMSKSLSMSASPKRRPHAGFWHT